MRLVDADALKESVRKKFKALPDRCEINELVNAAPTIDAISVEWLRKYQSRMTNISRAMGIDILLEMWQKEQEAR